ncbi:MAG: hypothetical protein OXC59_06995, partial [Acidimicrobiaceae bacterium]|nr:hypothetical protein [Acidimicrobiaceae bacterium]
MEDTIQRCRDVAQQIAAIKLPAAQRRKLTDALTRHSNATLTEAAADTRSMKAGGAPPATPKPKKAKRIAKHRSMKAGGAPPR